MTRTRRNLTILAAALGLLGLVSLSRPTGNKAPVSPSSVDGPAESLASPGRAAPTPSPALDASAARANERTYALPLSELRGLPPNAMPGASLELWAAWDPPVTPEPQVQLLLDRVTLDRIIPNVDLEAPATVLLRVTQRQVRELIWGDRYGSLSVAVLPSPPPPRAP